MQSEFERWWNNHHLLKDVEFFAPKEFLTRGAQDEICQCNTTPPRALWQNVVDLALFADAVRREFGSALIVLSAYRSPEYNCFVGGALYSQHKYFKAVDLKPRLDSESDRRNLIECAKLVRDRRGHGGVGAYSWGVHIDSRNKLANW